MCDIPGNSAEIVVVVVEIVFVVVDVVLVVVVVEIVVVIIGILVVANLPNRRLLSGKSLLLLFQHRFDISAGNIPQSSS